MASKDIGKKGVLLEKNIAEKGFTPPTYLAASLLIARGSAIIK